MNKSRIFLGGLVAGLVIALGESALDALIVQPALDAGRIERVPAPPPLFFLLRCALLGMTCMLLYAAMRTRLGPGAGTAAGAGLIGFMASILYPPFGLAMSTFPGPTLLAAIVWSAVELPLAAVAGARFYHEGSTPLEPASASVYVERMRRLVGREIIVLPSAAVLVFDDSGRALLSMKEGEYYWRAPGGVIEPDEPPADAAVRFVNEATSCLVTTTGVLAVLGGRPFRERHANGDEESRVVIVYGAKIIDGEPTPPEATTQLRFVHVNELSSHDTPMWLLELLEGRIASPYSDDA